MNSQEAKSILQAYRPGGEDASDPRFYEALEQARRDPELARWFVEERALDVRIGAKLKAATEPPADLKTRLLAQRRIVRPAPWWRQPASLMTAYLIASHGATQGTVAAVALKVPSPRAPRSPMNLLLSRETKS